jgi:[glutamine synthetase] adenylyltransferase / [glutamine synthetase]-adenylyl-L-tyrosine phosphorylase
MKEYANLPLTLQTIAQQRWLALTEQHPAVYPWQRFENAIRMAFALSDFIYEQSMRKPSELATLLNSGELQLDAIDYEQRLASTLAELTSETDLQQQLRLFRHWQMIRIAWRDLLNLETIESSLLQVSALASALITQSNSWLYTSLNQRFGLPMGEHGPQPLLIIGMGKLGGRELNFSSDIDLIFSYPSQGHTEGGRQSIEHQQFFTRLAQSLISALNQITRDGQVYRVDMRLRPLGDSGPLVMHFDALEDYYQEQGRDWERYAMLKGRVLNSDSPYAHELQKILQPFVYRRYLDFSAIEALRQMKALIQQEVRRRGLIDNIKLGQGGIREAEFVVQSLQLIRGGREPTLQTHSLLDALQQLENLEVLQVNDVAHLRESYLWLRKVEHCLQQFADRQTQVLPDNDLDKTRLAWVMQAPDYEAFLQTLQKHLDCIHQQFLLLIGEEKNVRATPTTPKQQAAIDVWQLELADAEGQQLLATWLTDNDALAFYQKIACFKQDLPLTRIGQRGLNTLNHLMPLLIVHVLDNQALQAVERLSRVLSVFTAILGRTAYLELLLVNQGALKQLVLLCDASAWVTTQLTRFPLLLDELINPATLYNPTPLHQYSDELRHNLLRVEFFDLEQQMEGLRQFKLSEQLKIAAADIAQALPVMKVSDHLTFLAEAIIHYVVDIAWQQMLEKYGAPVCAEHGVRDITQKSFAVLGFGKLGGWELGYGSDLDLVFIHNCAGNLPTEGLKPIESGQFYVKLVQRILHIFTTKTGLGLLYEVDMRLRPAGQSGLLVCHFNGFRDYQQNDAWTWEHQALCRARLICGDERLRQDYQGLRLDILSRIRDHNTLLGEVVAMREKMRSHLSKSKGNEIDLKQDPGGIADIEFIVQFLTLAHCHQDKELAVWTDNVRVLDSLVACDCMTKLDAQQLKQAYLVFRNQNHRLSLQNTQVVALNDELQHHMNEVKALWQKLMV